MARKDLPKGKGWYIWVVTQTMGGSPAQIAAAAKSAGLGHVLWHIHDGYLDEKHVAGGADLTPFIAAMEAEGIESWAWGAVYRTTWSQGADRVIAAFKNHPQLKGYVIDAEAPFKGAYAEATALMNKLRYNLPSTPIGLSSYRFPNYHPTLPWSEFRSQCDFDMPQVYWELDYRDDAGELQLESSMKIFSTMDPKLPYIPTGPAYKVGDWKTTSAQVLSLLDAARSKGLSAVNFWVWYQSMRDLPSVYNTIMEYKWSVDPGTDPEYSDADKLEKLWDAHPELH